jgi:NTP pyrophosphatase (non-canonical NTP hydrolase)
VLDRLHLIVLASQRRFPAGTDPYVIVTRLAEECGELAREVQHREGLGLKREKHGEPSDANTVKEVRQVMQCALEIALHYGLADELAASIEAGVERARADGLLSDEEIALAGRLSS